MSFSSAHTTNVPQKYTRKGGKHHGKQKYKKIIKYEVADELGVPLSNGYNGNLTAKQNGSVGGYMVKKMIEAQERQMAEKNGQ